MKLKALAVAAFTHSGSNHRPEVYNDGGGLSLVVSPANKKTWRLRYAFRGKRYETKLGDYPYVSLKAARQKAEDVRGMTADNINPKHAQVDKDKRQQMTFEVVALDWWSLNESSWQYEHARKVRNWIVSRGVPVVGHLPMDGIDAGHITEIMISMSNSECSPFLAILNRIFGRAMALRLTKHNPVQGFPLRDVIPPLPKTKHRAAIKDPKQLGQLLRDLRDNESGNYFTNQAAMLLPYIFVRPKELIHLRWDCVDFKARLLRLDASDMKKGRAFIVPMATQVMELLRELEAVSGYCAYVFPNSKTNQRPMSKNIITNKLRRMGYGGDVCCSHGFRSTASTLLNEMGVDTEIIELCLAHLTGSATSRAYNHAQHLPERIKLMQHWADYLDGLRDGAEVIPINRKRA